jgi:hypothetical protein
MAERVDIPDIERVTFFTGQRLTEKDFSALQRANLELGWLHNRSLHSWGIGIGLDVTGERGDSAVTVEPGYGVDCLGREIILTAPQTMPVPAVAHGSDVVSRDPGSAAAVYYLVAAYQEDADQKVAERRPGVCLPEGTVRLSEEPRLVWRRPEQLQEGFELVLAQAWIQNCRLSRPLSMAPRRYARPAHQPYIAAGQTDQEKTAWLPWVVNGQTVGVLTQVDTSAARFRTTPRYTAHVVGERLLAVAAVPIMIVGFPAVAAATPAGFTLQVLLPEVAGSNINTGEVRTRSPDIFNDLGWHVVWMGVEG